VTDDTSHADPWTATVAQMQQELLQRWLKLSAAPAEVSALFEWWPKLAATAVPLSFQQFGPAWELYFSLGRTMLQELGGGDAKAADPASRARAFATVMETWFEQLGSQLGRVEHVAAHAPAGSRQITCALFPDGARVRAPREMPRTLRARPDGV